MKEKKFNLDIPEEDGKHFYLELRDLSEASVQIWQHADGDKKTFIRVRISKEEWDEFLNEHQQLQTLQKISKRVKI